MKLFSGKGILTALAVPVLVVGILLTAGCTAADGQTLQGILQNIDSINGTVTMTTNDGQTHVLTIDNKTQFTFDGQTVALEALDPGAKIEVKVGDKKIEAEVVKAKLAKVAGTIASFQNGALSVTPQRGGTPVTVTVNATTQINSSDNATTTTDILKPGARVEVKYDPDTRVALRVFVNIDEEANIQGIVTAIANNQITVKDKKERVLTFSTDNSTRIVNGIFADIEVDSRVEARFDPVTMLAERITLLGDNQGQGSREDDRGKSDNRTGENENRGNNGKTDDDDDRGKSDNRTTGNNKERENETPPLIKHVLQGRENCLACHGAGVAGAPAVPGDHVGRTNGICLSCHKTVAA